MQVQQFRDIQGYLIPENRKPKFMDGKKNDCIHKSAHFVYCPNRDGLVAIQTCKSCEMYKGIKKYKGVLCEAEPKEPPYYYNTKNPKDNETDDNQCANHEEPETI